MNIAKFSAIRKRKCHLRYWTNKGNENHRRLYVHIGLSNWWMESFSLCDGMNFVVFIDCNGYDMFVVVLFSIPYTAGFQVFHKQSSRSIFPAPSSSSSSSSTPIASALIPMLWSCSTWTFMIAASGVTTIILETVLLCKALINLGKSWKIKLFPNPIGRMAMRLLPRNTFLRQSLYSICKVSTFGKSSSACRAVIRPRVTRWRMTFARARHIAFLVCVNNPLVLTWGIKFGQSEGIPDSGIPSWAF